MTKAPMINAQQILWKGIVSGALPRTPRFSEGMGAISELWGSGC